MTVNTSESAAACHQAHQRTEQRSDPTRTGSLSMVAAVMALPRTAKLIGGAVLGFGVLLAIGVPLATLTPLIAVGGCLSMHLFMGHGMAHGNHAGHETDGRPAAPTGNTEADSQG